MTKPAPTENGVLVPMSEEEMKKASQLLARLVRDLDVMEADHAEQRKTMRDERDTLRERISGVAESLRTQGR
jgi:hypothetical protein